MQGLACRKGRPAPSTLLPPSLALLLPAFVLGLATLANGACEFPASWAGQWYQAGKPNPVTVNATSFGDRTCIAGIVSGKRDTYIVDDYNTDETCYRCLIIIERHENYLTFKELGYCQSEPMTECNPEMSDGADVPMFRLNAKPIRCPLAGAPFTFSYNRGTGDCSDPPSLAESCTDDSKLLLKFQSCPDVTATESTIEELQCLAKWRDTSRDNYFIGTLKMYGRTELSYRCFFYVKHDHHPGGKLVYELAESGDASCNGLNSVSAGSRTIKLMKADKEHSKCKYPAWVTKHHDWHSLNGSRSYHFTSGNATLKVRSQEDPIDSIREEKIVCHNLEPMYPNDNMQGNRVKLVAHITSGCDIGYVCMIFHKRSGNVIEIQQSSEKAIMPDACSQSDPSKMPYTTLITSSLEQKKCPQPGRYTILDFVPTNSLTTSMKRQRRAGMKPLRTAEKMTWQEDSEDEECAFTDIQIGCATTSQNEMIIVNTCEQHELVYSCHESWEDDDGTWYTIVSRKGSQQTGLEVGETLCFSMQWIDATAKLPGRGGSSSLNSGGGSNRHEQQEQELWLSRPARTCQRDSGDQWTYKLASQGVCEDLTRAAASAGSSSSLAGMSLVLAAGAAVFCKLLSR